MKLDATDLRYITPDEFRVLTAVEMGSKNHEVVPTVLIVQISGLRNGGVNKIMGSLAKRNLVAKVQNSKYDGYRLTYGGYDYLAMRALSKRDSMYSVGNQIGVGKESDIYIVADAEGNEMVLKLHRLGRISFRAIKEKRDYLGKRKSASWMYMSRLAAQKEWAFMKVLYEHGFPVPRPIDQARHCILMGFQDAYPLRQISEIPSPGKLYSELMDLIVRFARAGLIHGDFNEFNILIHRETGDPIVIDFPQMVSTSHENAEWYFNRDVECIRTFFRRRFRYESALYPRFKSTLSEGAENEGDGFKLDVVVSASGFGRKEARILEEYMEAVNDDQLEKSDDSNSEEEEEEEKEEDEKLVEGDGNAQLMERGNVFPNQREDSIDQGGTYSLGPAGQTPMVDNQLKGKQKAERGDLNSDHSETAGLSDPSRPDREISRSPPQSRSPSPSSLEKMTASLSLSSQQHSGIKDIVSSDLTKQRARQRQKYHSKRGAQRIGRPKGSKAKQDTRVKLDKSGVWE